MASRAVFRPLQQFRMARYSIRKTFRRHNQTAAEAQGRSTFARVWNSEVGPKTVHFWSVQIFLNTKKYLNGRWLLIQTLDLGLLLWRYGHCSFILDNFHGVDKMRREPFFTPPRDVNRFQSQLRLTTSMFDSGPLFWPVYLISRGRPRTYQQRRMSPWQLRVLSGPDGVSSLNLKITCQLIWYFCVFTRLLLRLCTAENLCLLADPTS